MPRFTLKDLLIATTVIAFGTALLSYAFTHPRELSELFEVLFVLSGFTLIGVGLGIPFNRPWTGGVIAPLVVLVMSFVLRIVAH